MMKRVITSLVLVVSLFAIGGCVYGPGYYARPGVVYDGGGSYSYYDDGPVYGYGYYAAPGYYADPWCCYASPWIGLGFSGSYYYGGHSRGGWRGGHGGGYRGNYRGESHGSWRGGHRGSGHRGHDRGDSGGGRHGGRHGSGGDHRH